MNKKRALQHAWMALKEARQAHEQTQSHKLAIKNKCGVCKDYRAARRVVGRML